MADNYLTTGVYYNGRLYNITGQIWKQSQNYSTSVLYLNNIPYYLQLFTDETYINSFISFNYIKGFEVYTRNLSKPPASDSVTNIALANNVAVWQGEDSNSIVRWTTRANTIKGVTQINFTQCEIYDNDTDGLTLGTWNINNALNNLYNKNTINVSLYNTSPALLSYTKHRYDSLNNGRIIDRSGNWLNVNYVYFNANSYRLDFNNRVNNKLLTFTGIAEKVNIIFNQYQYANIYTLSLNNVQGSVKLTFKNQFCFNNRHILYIFNSNIKSIGELYNLYYTEPDICFDRQVEITIKNSFIKYQALFDGDSIGIARSEILGSYISLNLTNSDVHIIGMQSLNVGFLGYSPKGLMTSTNYNLNLIRNPSTWANFSSFNLIIDDNSRFISRTHTIYLGLNNSTTDILQRPYSSMTPYGVKWKGIYWNRPIDWLSAVLNYNMIVPLMAVSSNSGTPENSFKLGTLNPTAFSNISYAFDYEFFNTGYLFNSNNNAIITAVWAGGVGGGGPNSNFLILNPHAPSTSVPWVHTSRFTFLQMIGGRAARGWSVMFNTPSNTSSSLNTPFTLQITEDAGTFIDQRAHDGSIPLATNYMIGIFNTPYITNLHIQSLTINSNRKSPVFSGIEIASWYNIVINSDVTYAFRNCSIRSPIIINKCMYELSFTGTGSIPYYKLFDNCFFNNAVRLNISGYYQVISGGLTQEYNNDLPIAVLNTWSIIPPGNNYIYLRNNNSSLNIFKWLVNKGYNASRIYKI